MLHSNKLAVDPACQSLNHLISSGQRLGRSHNDLIKNDGSSKGIHAQMTTILVA